MNNLLIPMLFLTISLAGCESSPVKIDKDGLYALIETDKGNIVLQLHYDKTPITVANFVSLSEGKNNFVADAYREKKYYDGLTFHRVIDNFMIQGGDPTASGSGGPGYQFDDEITDLKHDSAGILSMANAGPGTNGSQFFITHKDTPWLDGKHTVFGKVIDGQDVVNSITQGDKMNKVTIIKKGKAAKKFDAQKVFAAYMEEKKGKLLKREVLRENRSKKYAEQKEKSKTTKSGLKYLKTKKGNGKAVNRSKGKVNVFYSVYFADGQLLDTNELETAKENFLDVSANQNPNKYTPIAVDVSPTGKFIEGFKEGLRLLKVGDRATLFIPYQLAYGEQDARGIPGKSDLIFEVEVVSLSEN